jgi:hypothetical protein
MPRSEMANSAAGFREGNFSHGHVKNNWTWQMISKKLYGVTIHLQQQGRPAPMRVIVVPNFDR